MHRTARSRHGSHTHAIVLLSAALALGGGGARAQDAGEERVLFQLPPAWTLTGRLETEQIRQLEYRPDATSPRANDESLRLEELRSQPLPSASAVQDLLTGDLRHRCSKLSSDRIASHPENGYPTDVRLYQCASARAGEISLQLMRIAEWAGFMRQVQVCRVGGIAHPCPAVTAPAQDAPQLPPSPPARRSN
jgi:hypothetical protein